MDNQNTTPTINNTNSQEPSPTVILPKRSKVNLFFVGLLLVAVVVASAAALNFRSQANKAKLDAEAIKSQLNTAQATTHDLPPDAVKLSECIPNMGYHYLPKGADPLYGPLLLVNKAGRVIGVEYMASDDMYTAIPNTDPAVAVLLKDSPMYGWRFDHTEFSQALNGHEGFEKKHVDVHNYTVSLEEQKQACQ
jgi:hypothetical protein